MGFYSPEILLTAYFPNKVGRLISLGGLEPTLSIQLGLLTPRANWGKCSRPSEAVSINPSSRFQQPLGADGVEDAALAYPAA